ncbi:MAG TPA: ComF family protein [Tepidiformaceae bacterium]|nr:ComF family protein [Tepidiformaceae bacterium]
MHLRTIVTGAVDLLYPPRCGGCGRFGTFFCGPCRDACTPAMGHGRCKRCSAEWDGADNCSRCFDVQSFESIAAAFEMTGPARRAVHRLKYGRVRAAAPEMAQDLGRVTSGLVFDFAVPVPLHTSRQRERGFNQASELLAPLGRPPLPGRLRRIRKTGQQVGLTMRERRQNIGDAFAYDGPPLDGASVLLVDDVVTTGATVDACARVLKDYGARSVYVAAYARASYKPGSDAPIED